MRTNPCYVGRLQVDRPKGQFGKDVKHKGEAH